MKKLASALPATVFLAWLYFLAFLYVQAYFAWFDLQGRVAAATVESLLMAGATAVSVGSNPWYLQAPLVLEFGLLGAMYWLASQLMPEDRRVDARVEKRRRDTGGAGRRYPAWLLAATLLALGTVSAMLAQHEGTLAARQVDVRFVAHGRGLRTLYLANGRRIRVGPALGCDNHVCSYLARGGALVLDRSRIVAEIPQRRQ